ncbi:Crp/Fnr family transcriptional regulator [Mycobacterium sp. SMC-4]|uniref:Crp/Fnr family transcriptional regulator n=1 Tax=Mycobacterium sp. SMC-4 TaxID=2857059 RepID=UPI0021B394C8|nr:Crp/Fnr family transcriptional regulator [Mycobacterium sp. SMC-4]UXA17332.1 Crp/Fnr family transcriptional regulator [Mycobacterium sp. SMC-4]
MIDSGELDHFTITASLNPATRQALASAGRPVSYPCGQRLFSEGQPAERLWLIRSGQVMLDSCVPGRGAVAVQTLGPGDLLGWSWLVAPYRWQFGARTTQAVEAIEFDAATLIELAEADPEIGHAMTRMLLGVVLDRLQATRARLLDLYSSPTEHADGSRR